MIEYMEWWRAFGLSDGRDVTWIQMKEPLTDIYENALGLTELCSVNFSIHGSAEQILRFLETVSCTHRLC